MTTDAPSGRLVGGVELLWIPPLPSVHPAAPRCRLRVVVHDRMRLPCL